MKRKIQQAFEHQTPNVLQSVLSECENEKGEIVVKKEKWQSVTPKKPKRFSWTAVAGIAAMIAVIVGVGFAVSGVVLVMAIYMIVTGTKKLRQFNTEV